MLKVLQQLSLDYNTQMTIINYISTYHTCYLLKWHLLDQSWVALQSSIQSQSSTTCRSLAIVCAIYATFILYDTLIEYQQLFRLQYKYMFVDDNQW